MQLLAPLEVDISDTIVSLEYTKMDKKSCCHCTKPFQTDELKVMRFDKKEYRSFLYHVNCFANLRIEIGWLCSGDSMSGYDSLLENDQTMIKKQFP